jgi:hypothetical protein
MTGSAKQSILFLLRHGLLRCARNDVDTPSRSRGAMRPRFDRTVPPKEGVGNAGCPVHPQPRVRK